MDIEAFEKLGVNLRHLGHRRHALADQIATNVKTGNEQESLRLFRELSDVSQEAIQLLEKQKQWVDQTIENI